MQKILILYGTLTGNTQTAAVALQDRLTKDIPGTFFDLLNIRNAKIPELAEYPLIIFGTSTWDDGTNNPDAEHFLTMLAQLNPDFSKIKFGLFGLGDSAYFDFCGVLPGIKEALERCGAIVYPEFFMVDGYPGDDAIAGMAEWAKTFLESYRAD